MVRRPCSREGGQILQCNPVAGPSPASTSGLPGEPVHDVSPDPLDGHQLIDTGRMAILSFLYISPPALFLAGRDRTRVYGCYPGNFRSVNKIAGTILPVPCIHRLNGRIPAVHPETGTTPPRTLEPEMTRVRHDRTRLP